MAEKTIKISTLKGMIIREYGRLENLYNVYVGVGNMRNSDYYAARLSSMIDLAAQIEQKTGATIFEDEGEECEATLTDSSPAQTSQNTPAKNTIIVCGSL